MEKARKAVLLMSIIMAIGLIIIFTAAFAAEGDSLETLYANNQVYFFTDMPGTGYGVDAEEQISPRSWGLHTLVDGQNTSVESWVGAIQTSPDFEFPYHIEMGFTSTGATAGECILDFTGISIGCLQGALRGITLFDVEELDLLTGKWNTVLSDVNITWENSDTTYEQQQFDFPETVRSARLRLVIKDANILLVGANYRFAIDELRAYGTDTGLKTQNLMIFNSIIKSYNPWGDPDIGSHPVGTHSSLYDGNYTTSYGVGDNSDWHFPITIEVSFDRKCLVTGFDIGGFHNLWTPGYAKRLLDKVSLYYAADGGNWEPLVRNYVINWQQSMSMASGLNADDKYVTAPKITPIYFDKPVFAEKMMLIFYKPAGFVDITDDGFLISELVVRGMEYTLFRSTICEDAESSLEQFQTDKLYGSYLALMEAISGISSDYPEFKTYYEDETDIVLKDIIENDVYTEIVYDPLTNQAAIEGYFFGAENTPVNISMEIVANGTSVANFTELLDANGEFSHLYDTSELVNHKYNVIAEHGGVVKTAQFQVGPNSDENSILSFSIGQRNGAISGRNITISLPTGSRLIGVVPIFTISDYATAYIDASLVESGKTSIDFSSPVTVTVISDSGLQADYTITAVVDEKRSSDRPGGGGTIIIAPKNPPDSNTEEKLTFSDIPTDHWAYDSVKRLYKEGIISGVDDSSFDPDGNLTREQLVKMLVIAFGIPEREETRFSDVLHDSWHYTYVGGAYQSGIVLGINDDLFGIGQTVKRQDAAVMIYRIIKDKLPSAQNTSKFTDDGDISGYAADAVYAMQSAGLINGYDGMFNPLGDITRAEAARLIASVISY